ILFTTRQAVFSCCLQPKCQSQVSGVVGLKPSVVSDIEKASRTQRPVGRPLAMVATLGQKGMLVVTKGKIIAVFLLILTWWAAALLPSYSPVIQAEIQSRFHEALQKVPAIEVAWHKPADPKSNYDQTKIALIVEPRPIPHLVPQILHMITVLPPDWRMVFIGSEASVVSVGRAFAVKHQQVIGKMDLMVLPEPWEIDSKEKVHRMMTDIRFYDEFLPGVQWILRFESDSILCANSETSLNEWLDWSWAGSPRKKDDRFSGNGGLSLRKVSAIRRVLNFQERYNDTEPEDEWFGRRVWVLPGEKVASGFDGMLAVEDVYMQRPMGFHVRDFGRTLSDDVWKDHKQRQKIFEYCPELSLIMDMKLERERCEGDDREGTIKPVHKEPEQKPDEDKKKKEEEQERKANEMASKLADEAKRKDAEAWQEEQDKHTPKND
ncbi:hypothetical protein PpBr36_03483, partial [Pyricularia pennisetigena]|uniref:hypothetical protein n=1 Tax=Pyricularia pennisetigena TaxID=1578925 RepID=UPI0011540CCE